MQPPEKQFHIQFTGDTMATSMEEALHMVMDQVADGSAHAEVTDDFGGAWEPDLGKIAAERRPVRHPLPTAGDRLTYDLVLNAARRLAGTLSPEQKDLLAALATGGTPERAQIVKDIAAAVLAQEAAPAAGQLDALVLANVRHAVGRSAHVVASTVDLVVAHWPDLSDDTREAVLDEVSHALAVGGVAMETDEREWNRLVAHASPSPRA